MRLSAILHGVRYGWRRYRCHHPAMQLSSVTMVAQRAAASCWWCRDCGLVLVDAPPLTVTR